MNKKRIAALRRGKRTRMKIKELQVKNGNLLRLSVHKTPSHTYAQVIFVDVLARTNKVVASASTLEKDIAAQCKHTGNTNAAQVIGKVIAERLLTTNLPGLPKVAFDRSGFKYHGRIKALADAARESGLDF
jgi:large subunit ribosomal protein L18